MSEISIRAWHGSGDYEIDTLGGRIKGAIDRNTKSNHDISGPVTSLDLPEGVHAFVDGREITSESVKRRQAVVLAVIVLAVVLFGGNN